MNRAVAALLLGLWVSAASAADISNGGAPSGAAGGGLAGSYPNPTVATVPASALPSGPLTNSIAAPVTLNNTGTFFDGPSVAQGTTGTWFASGTVTLIDTAGSAAMFCKLWDGTSTPIASGAGQTSAINTSTTVTLSARMAAPQGNLRISCKDATSTSGQMQSNATGVNLDSTITVYRIN